MGFNKYYIPEPKDLANLMMKNGPKMTVSRKIDAIIGNPDSIKIFDVAYEMVSTGMADSDVISELTQKFPAQFGAESN